MTRGVISLPISSTAVRAELVGCGRVAGEVGAAEIRHRQVGVTTVGGEEIGGHDAGARLAAHASVGAVAVARGQVKSQRGPTGLCAH